jgi:hypothetical protein
MKVSTVINTDTRAASSRPPLESLRYLDWTDFSVIVVNGASTDRTGALVEEYRNLIRVGACADCNVHGVTEYLAEPGDAYSLRRWLEALIQDEETRRSFRLAGRHLS